MGRAGELPRPVDAAALERAVVGQLDRQSPGWQSLAGADLLVMRTSLDVLQTLADLVGVKA